MTYAAMALGLTTNNACLPVTPLSRAVSRSRPEALRPRLTTGLPLRGAVS